MDNELKNLYESTAEDMLFCIGVTDLGTEPPAPIISIRYRDWSPEKLKVVRASFKAGIVRTHANA